MKAFVVSFVIASAATLMCQVAVCQLPAAPNRAEAKHMIVPMPKGRANAEADQIDKDWTSHIVHLKGNASVAIYTETKNPREIIVMHADELDLNETTGDIAPRGNVRLTVEDIK